MNDTHSLGILIAHLSTVFGLVQCGRIAATLRIDRNARRVRKARSILRGDLDRLQSQRDPVNYRQTAKDALAALNSDD